MLKRTVTLGMAASMLFACLALSALAQPEVVQPENVAYGGDFDAGFPCAFPVHFAVEGKEGAILFESRAILTAPGEVVHLTNLESNKTRSYVITGVFHDTYLDDGSVMTVATGRNAQFGYFDGSPGLILTIGKVVTVTTDGLNFDLIEEQSPGQIIDLCAALS